MWQQRREGIMRTIILIVLGLVISSPSIAKTNICQPAVDAALQKYGLAPSDVASTQIGRQVTGSEDGVLFAYQYWMRMKSCSKGHLIVDLTLDCQVKGAGAYTTGPCEIAGVPHC